MITPNSNADSCGGRRRPDSGAEVSLSLSLSKFC
jgi:hypothetical protein